ncbi:Sorting nexin-29 [Geodia barretti]|uniref:Sorting nexin-29 n=3 Tax=Geodia barretti TaxID=519541 RepID=A0AA35QTI1_GEOBA|nr:Sorting nexin-29 [Geodia barretti]
MLPIMAAGLCSILFSISLDSDSLNTPVRTQDTSLEATPLPSGPASKLLDVQPNQNGHVAESIVRKKRRKKPLSHTPKSDSEFTPNKEEGVVDIEDKGVALLPGGVSPDNLSSSPSLASFGSDLETPRFVALDTVLGNQSSSEAEAEAAVTATAMVLSATLSSPSVPRPHPLSSLQASSSSSSHTLSPEELREALLAMVKTKDELDEANKQLEEDLRMVRDERDRLATALTRSQTQLTSLQSAHLPQHALERENDILKEQLKMMVQRRDSLRFGDSTPIPGDSTVENSTTYEDEELLSSGTVATRPRPPGSTPSNNKLSEMADMHGELLELNDRLQRDLALKDNYITKLINTIQEAGLQVPVVTRAQSPPPSTTDESQDVVSVWIPSVIKRGRGPEAHHIYQVFVRIRDQEWNVYRRYAEFREFHKQLQQCIPEIASFHFPPKRALGNKSAQLVEERRQKLQDYLRVVMRLCTEPRVVQGKRRRHQLDPIMKKDIDRDTLQDILPFFKEDMHSSTPAVSQTHRLSYSGL